MKKYLLITISFLFLHFQSLGQIQCQQRLTPNNAARGQTLTTTISGTQFFNGFGSAPCNPSDVYLYQSSTATTIYATSLSIQNDSIRVSWDIPSMAPIGGYDLSLSLYQYNQFSSCLIGPTICYRPLAFGIGTSVISGSVFYDANQDSIFNIGDVKLSNRKVLLLPDSIITLSNEIGGYSFFTDTGTRTIVILNDSSFYSVSNDTITVNLSLSNLDSLDFAIYPTFINYKTNIYLGGRPRCNTIQNYDLTYSSSSAIPVNLVIKFFHSSNTQFIGSSISPDSIVGDTVYFSVLNHNYGTGSIYIQLQIPAQGNSIILSAIVNTFDLGGNIVATSSNKLAQAVACSFDPNDKNVNPTGNQAQHYTFFGDPLFYTIRFQNTGNDTAYDVHIIDTIDVSLDLSSLEIISSSHPVFIEVGLNRAINFRFNNIMLPDSFVDEPASNGYVSYAIRTLDSLPEMTLITNTAYIYFDQNSPVETNQTFNTMVTLKTVGIHSPDDPDKVFFYPNPFNELVTITNFRSEKLFYNLTIIDIQGRELYNNFINTNNYNIDLHNLVPGIYIYKLLNLNTDQLTFGRLIKQ